MQGEQNDGGQSAKGPSISFTSLSNYRLGFEVEIYARFWMGAFNSLLLVWSVLNVLVHLIESRIHLETKDFYVLLGDAQITVQGCNVN